ncbi:hypothetical protein AB1K62_14450 [Parasphingorhabdus sp. JC815]|uniref:hypothetical protein n=1 Tax=Parasphingorhabdus sp. JC815 TaxID=3232140 RepID=UPI00345873B6
MSTLFIDRAAKALGVTVEQFQCLEQLHRAGHHCGVFRHPDTLIAAMRRWGWV